MLTPLERVAIKTAEARGLMPTLCWLYTGCCLSNGYGQFSINGKREYVHRWAYSHFVATIPDGLQIDHLCRNRACWRPGHLDAVTPRENSMRGAGGILHVQKTKCIHGHAYTAQNTYTRAGGGRYCLQCKNARRRALRK